ncbi:hypothetical protein [Methylobacterium trifolii]|uniref:Uncharacterized protein n=1 Tax=Methylobacterium trifolii TaxID=1003092 RepID=A0ABQ4TWV9_9HYPH|nr:hypothetical protein [Methylobacterium trifolii]GJE59046.1 hypothetical protein MPOCJGCO_1133 [Methylobacterium trifolii]
MAILDLMEWVSDGLVAGAVLGAASYMGWVAAAREPVLRLLPVRTQGPRR